MARKAFVIGSNGPPEYRELRYAERDADRLAAALAGQYCRFEVARPHSTGGKWELLREVETFAQACRPEDTFVLYFSGHGMIEQGELLLLWDKAPGSEATTIQAAIPAGQLFPLVNLCPAQNKLVILDCCHAGGSISKKSAGGAVTEAVPPANHLVFVASERIERVPEIDELQASLFTDALCAGLTESFAAADDDGDQRISIDDMVKWVQSRVQEHNENSDVRVPYPYLYGQRKGPLYLSDESLTWFPVDVNIGEDHQLVIAPIRPYSGLALAMDRYPVTNEQYRRFVEDTNGDEPVGSAPSTVMGQQLTEGDAWVDGFRPWENAAFAGPRMPVVCVSYGDALEYADWLEGRLTSDWDKVRVHVPNTLLWDVAAFGDERPPRTADKWLVVQSAVHQTAAAPAPIDGADRTNVRGYADMIGNVWEWTRPERTYRSSVPAEYVDAAELRGGGFLDDMSEVRPWLDAGHLSGHNMARRCDLGFRLAATLPVDLLPEDVRIRLSVCPQASTVLWTPYTT